MTLGANNGANDGQDLERLGYREQGRRNASKQRRGKGKRASGRRLETLVVLCCVYHSGVLILDVSRSECRLL